MTSYRIGSPLVAWCHSDVTLYYLSTCRVVQLWRHHTKYDKARKHLLEVVNWKGLFRVIVILFIFAFILSFISLRNPSNTTILVSLLHYGAWYESKVWWRFLHYSHLEIVLLASVFYCNQPFFLKKRSGGLKLEMSFNLFTEEKDNCDILFFNDLDVFLFLRMVLSKIWLNISFVILFDFFLLLPHPTTHHHIHSSSRVTGQQTQMSEDCESNHRAETSFSFMPSSQETLSWPRHIFVSFRQKKMSNSSCRTGRWFISFSLACYIYRLGTRVFAML